MAIVSQVVVPREVAESSDCVSKGLKQLVATGSSVLVEGTLVEAPPGKEQVHWHTIISHQNTSDLWSLQLWNNTVVSCSFLLQMYHKPLSRQCRSLTAF
jgi:hypothetical protein